MVDSPCAYTKSRGQQQERSSQNDSTIIVKPGTSTTYSVNGTNTFGCINSSDYLVNVSPCTGISEQEELSTSIQIYPNPNSGEFTIHAQSDMNLILLNSLGQVIKTITFNEGTGHFVSVKTLSNGIYFLKSTDQQHRFNSKIIVSK